MPEVVKTGSTNLTFCVTFHNFFCQILACLPCSSRLMQVLSSSFIFSCFLVRNCVEVDVDIITPPLPTRPHPYAFVPTHNFPFKVESYPLYGPKSLFKFGEKRPIVCYCTHEQKMNFQCFTQDGCYGNQPRPFEVVFYSIDANTSCSFFFNKYAELLQYIGYKKKRN